MSVCVCVGQSNISTVTEIQETAPSATNVATSIKFPPSKGHHREPITSESLSLACLKPLWRRPPPHPHLAALANTYLHPSDKNLFILRTNTTDTAVTAERCVSENTLVGKRSNTSVHTHTVHTHTCPARKTLQLDLGETKKIRLSATCNAENLTSDCCVLDSSDLVLLAVDIGHLEDAPTHPTRAREASVDWYCVLSLLEGYNLDFSPDSLHMTCFSSSG